MAAQVGSTDNAGIRALLDDQQTYFPADTTIAEGHVVVFDNTSGDNRMVVRPAHATALLGGRAFAGISADVGSPVAAQDTMWTVQRQGIANCKLKDSTACTRGDLAAYDPVDNGTVVPYTSKNQIVIGRFQQTLSSGTSQMVGVALRDVSGDNGMGLIGGVVADATQTTNVATEQTFTNATQTIKANRLVAGSIVDVEGMVVVTNQNAADTLTIRVKIGSTAIVTSTAVDPATGDVVIFRARVKIRTAGAAGTLVAMGQLARGVDAAVAGSTVLDGTASTAIDTTAATTVSVTGEWSGASANNVAVARIFDVIVL